jgi:hypothetical protein
MRDNIKYHFEIYHNGAHFKAPVRGKKRFLAERTFLDQLVGAYFAPHLLPRPVPDPSHDFYMLSDEQLEAYSAFRKKLERESK